MDMKLSKMFAGPTSIKMTSIRTGQHLILNDLNSLLLTTFIKSVLLQILNLDIHTSQCQVFAIQKFEENQGKETAETTQKSS